MPLPRTLVIGIDGATWDLLGPAIERGWLPNLARFLAGARRGRLRSVEPPVTIPAWHSIVTGLSPATMNRWGFTQPTTEPGRFTLVTTYRPHEAVWDALGRLGWKVGVVNFPTVPAPPVQGFFISGMLPTRGAATTYPLSLARRLDRDFGGWSYDLPAPGNLPHRRWLEIAARSLDQKALATETLVADHAPDFLFVLFSETDRVQHNLYDLLLGGPDPPPELVQYWGAIDAAFQRVFLAFHGAGRRGYTWVLSDHGFGPAEGYFFTNRFLVRRGYLVLGRTPRAGARPFVTDLIARLDRLWPMARPVRWADQARLRLTRQREGDGDSLDQTFGWFSRFVDWERTRAFSAPIPEAIYANFYRGEPTPEERRQLKRDLTRELTAFSAASIRVIDPEVEYGRALPPEAPLLLLSVNDHAWETRGDLNHTVDHLGHRPSYFERHGTHRHDGIVALAGPDVSPGVLGGPVPLLSVAPSLHLLLGIGSSRVHEGRPDPHLLAGTVAARSEGGAKSLPREE